MFVFAQNIVKLTETTDLLIIKLSLAEYLINHFQPSIITRFKDLVTKLFFKIKATEGSQKKFEELVKTWAGQQLD